MPVSRYEIRNEYSLADPELYRAADKDDPEALLEGVAMAGLVGVLRQLGDLAEFAAETFHNLHEEVMSTAARGHSLMVRVQQLETEVPSIEKAFLSQTDHSSFLYNDGVDCRPNLRMDENLITRGDLPRFIMDSYEECRPPPRLFLLDKFDIAGAGACLKRYTDPSIFKVETSGMTSTDVQREKKILRPKKKVSQWRGGETPELLPTSHTKLHQLLSEERVELGVSNPSRRVKLKRKLNGFPFNSKTRKSYMEKLLMSPLPDDKLLVKVNSSSTLMPGRSDQSRLEVPEVRSVSPDKGNLWRKRSCPPSPDREETVLNPSTHAPTRGSADDKISAVPDSYSRFGPKGLSPSTSDKMTGEKVIAVDAESSREGRTTGSESDGIVSEVENFVDAPLTMESDTDTEPKLRMKNDFTSPVVKSHRQFSDAYEEHINYRSSDSLSIGGSMISDEGNNSSGKEISSFSSHSRSTSAENPHPERYGRGFASSDIPGTEIGGALSNSTSEHASDFEQVTSRLGSDESISSSVHSDITGVVTKYMLRQPGSDETASTSDGNEKGANLVSDTSYHPDVSNFKLQRGNGSARSSTREHLKNEPNGERIPSIYTVPGNFPTTKNSMSLDTWHGDESKPKDGNRVENLNSRLNMPNFRSRRTIGTRKLLPSEYPTPGKPADEFPKLLVNNPSDHPDMVRNRSNVTPMVPQEESIVYLSDNRDSNSSIDAPNHLSGMTVASPGKKLDGMSWVNAQTVDAKENHPDTSTGNQICSKNFISLHRPNSLDCLQEGMTVASPGKKLDGLSWANAQTVDAKENHPDTSTGNQICSKSFISLHQPNSLDCLQEGLGAAGEEIIPERQTLVHKNLALGSSKSCEVVGLCGKATTDHVSPNNSGALESSCHMPEKIDNSAGRPDQLDTDGNSTCMSFIGKRITEFSDCTDLKSPNEACVRFSESDSDGEKSGTADLASTELADSKDVVVDDVHTKAGIEEFVEEHVHCIEHSGVDEPVCDKNHLAGIHAEAGLGDEAVHTNAAAEDFETVLGNCSNNDYPKSEVYETVCNSHLDLEVENDLQFAHATADQSLGDQTCVGSKRVFSQQSHLEDHVSDALILLADYGIGQSKGQDESWLQPNQLVQELLHSGMNSEASSLSINHLQIVDHVDPKGDGDAAFKYSLVDHPNSVSVSEPQIQNDMDASGYPKETLNSIPTPYGPFSGTNQITPPDQPALPPLPPLQWRMGRLQHASSSTEVEVKHMELSSQLVSTSTPLEWRTGKLPRASSSIEGDVKSLKELSQQFVSPLHAPSYGFTSTLLTASVDVGSPSSLISPTDVGSLSDDSEHALAQIASEVRVENYDANLETKTDHEMVDIPSIRSDQKQLVTLTPEGESTSAVEEELAHGSHTGKLSLCFDSIVNDVAALDKSQPSEVTDQVRPQVNERDLLLVQVRTNDTHEPIVLPPKVKTKQLQFVLPTLKSEVLSPAEEDGAPSGSHMGKLPEPCDTLEDATVLDNSQVSDVKEPDGPQVQKVDERDLLSEQVGTEHMHETVDHPAEYPARVHSKQQESVMPNPESDNLPPAEENGVPHGSHTEKLPHPHDTLVEDVGGLDKSKQTEVTAQVRPPVQKVDERNSESERMRTQGTHEARDVPIKTNPQQLVTPTPESEFVSPANENGAAHGSHTVKQRFPHNPLVEDVSSLDKSKLRKVTDRVKSQLQRVDERDSLLEQIRAKSFNLRRATTSKPSIPGPQTNIQVAAILEKANAIRQAMAGSDEDEDDSWSDS